MPEHDIAPAFIGGDHWILEKSLDPGGVTGSWKESLYPRTQRTFEIYGKWPLANTLCAIEHAGAGLAHVRSNKCPTTKVMALWVCVLLIVSSCPRNLGV